MLWGSLMPRADEAEAYFQRHNPSVEGHEQQYSIAPVLILLDDSKL